MARHVLILFEVDDSDTSTDDQVSEQIETAVAALLAVPDTWTYNSGHVLDDHRLQYHRLTTLS